MNRLLLPLLLASSAVFAQDAVPTVRICDSSGCSDRPRDSASFQPEATDPVAEQRLLQLTEVARDDPRAAYFRQVKYGMYVRMALIARLLGASGCDSVPVAKGKGGILTALREGKKK